MGSTEVNVTGPKVSFEIFGLKVTETVVLGWFVIAVITAIILFMTHNMSKTNPSKKQIAAEWIVQTFTKMVKDSMGSRNLRYAPYMATIFMFSIFGSLISLLGLRPVTGDYNTTRMGLDNIYYDTVGQDQKRWCCRLYYWFYKANSSFNAD